MIRAGLLLDGPAQQWWEEYREEAFTEDHPELSTFELWKAAVLKRFIGEDVNKNARMEVFDMIKDNHKSTLAMEDHIAKYRRNLGQINIADNSMWEFYYTLHPRYQTKLITKM